MLRMRQVVFWCDFASKFVLDVFDYADNFHPRRAIEWSGKAQTLTDRVLTRPVFSRECLVHDYHRQSTGFVVLRKCSTPEDGNLHRGEVIGSTDANPPDV